MRYYDEEKPRLLRVAAGTIGRILRHEFEPPQDLPDHVRQLIIQLDTRGRTGDTLSNK
jgi:hypothetical protein